MADPRKQVRSVTGSDWDAVSQIVHAHLVECTRRGAGALRCTGGSFVTMAVGIWAAELAELDAALTAKFLRALADRVDPTSTLMDQVAAEADRKEAVLGLLAALDLLMTAPEGRS